MEGGRGRDEGGREGGRDDRRMREEGREESYNDLLPPCLSNTSVH